MLGKFRRGQVRGIDFSLALIIFVLVMSQIVVLTTTFIESSQSAQSTQSDISFTESFANGIITNPGGNSASTAWADTPTNSLPSDWKFGLANQNARIDPYKLGRLADNSLSEFLINNSFASSGTDLDGDFSFTLAPTINLNLIVTDQSGSIKVNGSVTQNQIPLEDTEVWIFSIDSDFNIETAYLRTNQFGNFSTTINTGDSNYFEVIGFTRYGNGAEDITRRRIADSGSIPNQVNVSMFEDHSNTNSSSSTIQFNNVGDGTVNTIVMFPSTQSSTNHTTISGATNLGDKWNVSAGIPIDGLVAILTQEDVGGTDHIGFTTFPLILNGENHMSSPLEPSNIPNTQATLSEVLMSVRGVIMEGRFKVWR